MENGTFAPEFFIIFYKNLTFQGRPKALVWSKGLKLMHSSIHFASFQPLHINRLSKFFQKVYIFIFFSLFIHQQGKYFKHEGICKQSFFDTLMVFLKDF